MHHKKNRRFNTAAIKGIIPALSKKYSEKEIRDIAIESHIEKFKKRFRKNSINYF